MACEAGADVRGDHHQAEEILLLHYADIIRVNNVRNAWKSTPRPGGQRQLFDRSLWESVQRKDPEGLRKPDRGGMAHASVVCVLVGTETGLGRGSDTKSRARSSTRGACWRSTSIACSTISAAPDVHGDNPLDYMAVGRPNQAGVIGPAGGQSEGKGDIVDVAGREQQHVRPALGIRQGVDSARRASSRWLP